MSRAPGFDPAPDPAAIPLRGLRAGAVAMLPVAVLMIPYGLAFGVFAAERGLSPLEVGLMSALVLSGAAQYAALGFDLEAGASFALAAAAFAVGARHLIYGAALAPRLGARPGARLWVLALMTDPNFADAEAAFRRGETGLGRLLGGGLALWLFWVAGTAAGAAFGAAMEGLERIGADAAMPAFFAAALAGDARRRGALLPVAAGGGAAFLLCLLVPPGPAILGGAVAGGLAGAVRGALRA